MHCCDCTVTALQEEVPHLAEVQILQAVRRVFTGGDLDDLTLRKVRTQVEGILGNKHGPMEGFTKLISAEIDSLLKHTQELQKKTKKTLVKEVVEAEIMTEKEANRFSKAALAKTLATHMAQREQEALTQRQCTGKEGGPVCPDDD